MNLAKNKTLLISLLLSLLFHLLVFGTFFIMKLKPKEEKEKIITLSLEEFNKEFTPKIQEEKKVTPQKPTSPEEIFPQPQPVPKPQPEKPEPVPKPVETQKKQEIVNETLKSQDIETDKKTQQVQEQPKPQPQPTTQKTETSQIDLLKGRPDQFKQPEKKEEDIDGYLKELIKYLNQQARERDLYPPIAKRLKIEGQVIIRVTINEDGTINEDSIKIVESSGYNVLDRGAVEILKKLQPYKKPPKRITVEIPIVFQIIYM